MSVHLVPMTENEAATVARPDGDAGLGALTTERGNLPLESIEAAASITGLVGRTVLAQGFVNPHDVALEATYIFPLPDRAAVTAMRMTADGRVVDAELKERGQARREYDQAIAQGKRASIAEEERPDVFTMRVGNILPGERVSVELTFVGPLSYEDGEATYRLPLVVAPRYIPGSALDGPSVGAGYADDTDAVPDASRITPPVLLPGFPHPVRLAIGVDIDAAGLSLGEVKSSLHDVTVEGNHLSIRPGERANRDFVLRLHYGEPESTSHALTLTPDADGAEGTFRLTVLPPTTAGPPRPRDVVLVLDRSGSMAGWKMVAARRAAARIVDTLNAADRFAVLTFDNTVDRPADLPKGLAEATDRNRYRAVEHLARVEARGGTEMLEPLTQALALLSADGVGRSGQDEERDRVLVLVTDGQVGNEDQILSRTTAGLSGVRMHSVGVDRAVNAGFLGRLAAAGGGRCELVESEDRLDEAMDRIHRRIGAPLVTGLTVEADGLTIVDDTVAPARWPDLFPGAPMVVTGRFRGAAGGAVTVRGQARAGGEWSARMPGVTAADPAVTAVWARAHLRDLEDRYVGSDLWPHDPASRTALERRIVDTSLRFGVLCRFTAWLAVDSRVVTGGGQVHRVVQPVEPADGWAMLEQAVPMAFAAPMMARGITLAGRSRPFSAAGPAAMAGGAAPAPGPASAPAPAAIRLPGRRPKPKRGGAAGPEVTLLAEARRQAGEEVRRLRAASGADEYERRELLADLGSRLDALVRHLAERGVDAVDLTPVRDLADELRADRPMGAPADVLAELWTRALRVLDDFAEARQGGSEFWKRVP
jgi:Ca-activated chloride channel family protein